MPSPADSTASVLKGIRRFRRNRRGSAAVEFALVAPVFFALLFAIIETGLLFFASQVLESVTQQSARLVLTDQASSGYSQAQFQTYVCSQIPAILSCGNVSVDVESFSSFQAIALNNLVSSCAVQPTNLQYSPGNPGDVVVVRLLYPWQLFVTGLAFYGMSGSCGGQRMLVATAAFRNEP